MFEFFNAITKFLTPVWNFVTSNPVTVAGAIYGATQGGVRGAVVGGLAGAGVDAGLDAISGGDFSLNNLFGSQQAPQVGGMVRPSTFDGMTGTAPDTEVFGGEEYPSLTSVNTSGGLVEFGDVLGQTGPLAEGIAANAALGLDTKQVTQALTEPSTGLEALFSKLTSSGGLKVAGGVLDLFMAGNRQKYIDQLPGALNEFSGSRSDPAFIRDIDKKILQLTKNPDKFLNNSEAYTQGRDALEQTVSRTMIAQGHNPAESGFGAVELARTIGTFRQDFINNERNWLESLKTGQDQFAVNSANLAIKTTALNLDNLDTSNESWGGILSGLGDMFKPREAA